MSSFPFLDLALLPQVEIVQSMKLSSLLKLSTSSQKMTRLLQEARIPLLLLRIRFKDQEEKEVFIDVQTLDGDWHVLVLRAKVDEVDGNENEMFTELTYTEDFVGGLPKLFHKIDSIELQIFPEQVKNPIWKHLESLDVLEIVSSEDDKILNSEDVNVILKVKRDLIIAPRVQEGFKWHQGFQQRGFVSINNATWIHLDAVIHSRSREIHLKGIQKPSARRLNQLLKFWMKMEKMENLKHLCLTSETKFSSGFSRRALEGIERIPLIQRGNHPIYIRRVDRKMAKLQFEEFKFEIKII